MSVNTHKLILTLLKVGYGIGGDPLHTWILPILTRELSLDSVYEMKMMDPAFEQMVVSLGRRSSFRNFSKICESLEWNMSPMKNGGMVQLQFGEKTIACRLLCTDQDNCPCSDSVVSKVYCDVDFVTYVMNEGLDVGYYCRDEFYCYPREKRRKTGLESYLMTERILNRTCKMISSNSEMSKENAEYFGTQLLSKLIDNWSVDGFEFITYKNPCASTVYKTCPICMEDIGWDYFIQFVFCDHRMHDKCFQQMLVFLITEKDFMFEEIVFRCPECRNENEMIIMDGPPFMEGIKN